MELVRSTLKYQLLSELDTCKLFFWLLAKDSFVVVGGRASLIGLGASSKPASSRFQDMHTAKAQLRVPRARGLVEWSESIQQPKWSLSSITPQILIWCTVIQLLDSR